MSDLLSLFKFYSVFSERKYTSSLNNHTEKRTTNDKVLSSLANEAVRESLGSRHSNSTTPSPAGVMFNSTSSSTPAISYSLGRTMFLFERILP